MNKKFVALMLSIMLTLTIVLAGCAKKEEPKEAMKTAALNALTMSSYEMKSSIVIEDLQFTSNVAESNPNMNRAITMLRNAEVTLNGIHQADPQQTEMQIGINLKGDMAISFNMDMVMTKDKLYIKVPNIPTVPLPENLIGKYVELDLKKLSEESGKPFNPEIMDTKKTQKLANEIMEALITEYDQAKYFKEIDKKDAKLPEGVEANQVVQFFITNDNVKEALDILINKAAPKIVDIVGKDEYREMLGLTKEEIDQAKNEIKNINQGEFSKGVEELQKYLKINAFNINTAIDKKNFPVYQDLSLNVDVNDPEADFSVKLAVKGSTQYSKINEKQTFKIGIPKGSDVVTMDQLKEMGDY